MKKNANTTTTSNKTSKLERKIIEKNRRVHMKGLCFQLVSSIPSNYLNCPKEMLSQQEQLDVAATYIKHLRERIEKLKGEKEQATMSSMNMMNPSQNKNNVVGSSKLPLLEIKDLGNGIEVTLVSEVNKNFMLHEVITVLEEEGAEVVTANFSTIADKIFYTIHAQVKISRVGVEPARVHQRLQELIAPLDPYIL